MTLGVRIRQLGQLVQGLSQSLYQPPGNTIPNVSPANWPSASQPVHPLGNPGSQPLGMPIQFGQNQTYTPRPDAEYTFDDLRRMSCYPLARICIENVKDQLCQLGWRIELAPLPGESPQDTKDRRKTSEKGDNFILRMSRFLERPDGQRDWNTWLRLVLEDMLTIDAPSVQIRKTFQGKLAALRWLPGNTISCYIDDNGDVPMPPAPAYAQLWEGIPRVNLSQDQLIYRPRNIVPRNTLSSYLYGFGPVEQLAPEIEIGVARMQSVMRYYDAGAIPDFIHVAPSKVTPDQMRKAMDWVNSELAGNLDRRRQYRIIQGFSEDGKGDNIVFPKEPVLADVFDDLHIRKICFGFGTAPQRLMRMMNRASAQVSQKSAEEEGIRPWMTWIERTLIGQLLFMVGGRKYRMVMSLDREHDELKKAKIDTLRVKEGIRTINDINRENGDDLSTDPAADQLAITTQSGRVPIGMKPTTGALVPKTGDPEPVARPKKPVNGVGDGKTQTH